MPALILLVDDDPITCKTVRSVLEMEGVRVVEAHLGAEAVAVAERSPPDLVLLDLGLPDVDSFSVAASLRAALGAHVPLLALTGIMNVGADARRTVSTFDDVVVKPIEATRLRAAVRTYLPDKQPVKRAAFGEGRKLLVADDNAAQRKMVAFTLGRLGFEVTTAADGREALELARATLPHAIVSDVLMPHLDGFELCARLRSEATFANIPVLLLTNSYVEDSDRALALRAGADAYVIRHDGLKELTEALRRTMDGRPAQDRVRPQEDVEHERAARAARQLDRQVAANAVLTQRTAILAAQLDILGGLTTSLIESGDVEAAMDAALGSCFDAGGISWGVLIARDGAGWTQRSLGLDEHRRSLIGRARERLLQRIREDMAESAGGARSFDMAAVVDDPNFGSALVAPIVHRGETMGALVLGATDTVDEQRRAFAGVVAAQAAFVLALSNTLRALERASRAEQERAEQLGSILDAISEAVVLVDRSCKPVKWNRAGTRFAERGMSGPVGEWAARFGLFHADQTRLYGETDFPLVRALAGEAVDDAEICVLKSGADPVSLTVSARPVHGADQAVVGAVGVIRDVTGERRAQERQIVTDRMASVGVLAAGVAHEINNPMTSVIAELEMAIEDLPTDSMTADHLRAARDAALRVSTIVRDLKTLSRGGVNDELAKVDLARVIQAAARVSAPETRPRATVTLEIGPMPRVVANEARLVQVMVNLLVNAAQAIPPDRTDGSIVVRGSTESNGALIEVADSGSGMTPETRASLFTPFFTTKPVGSGTGLGLAISHRIIAGANGTIGCDARAEGGTVFRIWLPAAPTEESEESGTERARLAILAVDEDPFGRQTIIRALRAHHDLSVLDRSDAGHARVEAGEAFDALLWSVPPRDGLAKLVDKVSRWPRARIERLTVAVPRAEETEARRCAERIGFAVLLKPLDTRRVAEAIGRRTSVPGTEQHR